MKWIVYSAVLVNQVTRAMAKQVRRAPVPAGETPALAAARLGGTLLAVHSDAQRAEGLRRLTEMQAVLAGYDVVEWSAPAEWETGLRSQKTNRQRITRVKRPAVRRRLVRAKAPIQRRRPRWH